MSIFGTVLLLAASAMHIFVTWRASAVPGIRRRLSRRALLVASLCLWLLLVLGRTYARRGEGLLAGALELAGMYWLGTLLLLMVCLLVVDIARLARVLPARLAPSSRGLALVAGVSLALVASVQARRAPVIQSYEVTVPHLPAELDGTVLVGIADTHIGRLTDEHWLAARVAQVQAEKPDVIVLLGDIVEGHAPSEALVPVLRRLEAPLGVWAVAGNHERYGREGSGMAVIEQAGIRVLHNAWAELQPGLVLAGVEDLTRHRRARRTDDPVAAALAGRPRGATVLLSHTPTQLTGAAAEAQLLLCGHTHAGQIWPFGYLVGLYHPFFAGRYDAGDTTVIVSRGAGTWGPRMRLWRRGEILRVTLRAQQALAGPSAEAAEPESL